MSASPHRGKPSPRPWAWLSAVLAVTAVALLVVAVQAAGPRAPRGVVADPLPARATSAPSTPAPVAAAAAQPVGLRIPAIEVEARIIRLGLNRDRTVQVPSDPAETGWYRLGPHPGQRGSAVILGHLDSVQGPAVFFRLRHLEPGDQVVVDAADGTSSTFRVVRLATYRNERFPARQVYAAPGRRRVLNLVTCGGEYDPRSGYQSNVVVYTRWVRDT